MFSCLACACYGVEPSASDVAVVVCLKIKINILVQFYEVKEVDQIQNAEDKSDN